MIYNVNTFDYTFIDHIDIIKKNNKYKNGKNIKNIVCAFDIETTRLKDIEQSVMYIWQFQLGLEYTVIGRTWDEFINFITNIQNRLNDTWLIVYVHNLSYEFQFLKGIYKFNSDDVFCTDFRKVLKCEMFNCIELRCSYYLTNMSLDKLLKKYNVENKKLTGKFDYNKIRFSWSKLSDDELQYCINDVKGLVQAIYKQLKSDSDTLQTIPLTSTGYVRRDIKKAMRRFNNRELREMLPDVEVYKLLREAFRGGDTLSNRWNTDIIIDNVKSIDIVSSYPSSMLINEYPMTKFYLEDVDDFEKLYKQKTHALLFRVAFINIDVKDGAEGHLYLSRDKCRNIDKGTFVNGRILCADYLETTLTDIDWDIVNRRYKYDGYIIIQLYSSRYKKLPSMFRDVIYEYYKIKTELKGVPEDSDDYYYYMKNKEKLNSSYGMTVEDIGKDDIKFVDGVYVVDEKPLQELIEKNNKKAFAPYFWGVWCTAHSRKRLADGIDTITKNNKEPMNFIYSDTDSIKYTGDIDIKKFNEKLIEDAKDNNAYAIDNKGTIHYMGVFESEGYMKENKFKTLGAKKYVIEDASGLHITIAGVNKVKGAKELKTINSFKEGFIFNEGGGTESVYNDNIDMYINVDDHILHITDNVVIRDSMYTLGITEEYRRILNGLVDIKYSDVDIKGLYKVKS